MPQKYTELAEMFKLFANPIRLKIMVTLDEHTELSVQELVEKVGVSALTLSPHLARLRRLRALNVERKNGMAYYSLANKIISSSQAVFLSWHHRTKTSAGGGNHDQSSIH